MTPKQQPPKAPGAKPPKRRFPKARLYVYDYEADSHGRPDALDRVSDGIVYEANEHQTVRFESEGRVIEISSRNGRLELRARTSGLTIQPYSSNVLFVTANDL